VAVLKNISTWFNHTSQFGETFLLFHFHKAFQLVTVLYLLLNLIFAIVFLHIVTVSRISDSCMVALIRIGIGFCYYCALRNFALQWLQPLLSGKLCISILHQCCCFPFQMSCGVVFICAVV